MNEYEKQAIFIYKAVLNFATDRSLKKPDRIESLKALIAGIQELINRIEKE